MIDYRTLEYSDIIILEPHKIAVLNLTTENGEIAIELSRYQAEKLQEALTYFLNPSDH